MMRSAREIADGVRSGKLKAVDVVQAALADIAARDAELNCFTRVLDARALAEAAAVDAIVEAGGDPGVLAGVPYAVKDLFDVKGLPTTAGAGLRRDVAPAECDAAAVRRMAAAGAVLVGTTNMDEFAYGFVTVNAHYGTTRNPCDPERLAGGSSGGSAAAVAAGFVPIALGSDTNGSIRVPASLCGIWGMRPGDGRIDQAGVFPFVHSLDEIGPFARNAGDLALAFGVLADGATSGTEALRVGRLDGWFVTDASAPVMAAFETVAARLGAEPVSLSGAAAARSAAFVMSAAEGGKLHADTLNMRAMDYDSAVRDRLLAGALLSTSDYIMTRDVRTAWRQEVDALLDQFDVLIAPATPAQAPLIADDRILIGGEMVPARAHLGIYAQPLSLAGVPVVSAPAVVEGLPVGMQCVAGRGKEEMLLAWAAEQQAQGIFA